MSKVYREISEDLQTIRTSVFTSLESLEADVREFGGCIIGENDEFVYGHEWVYEEFIK